jgi:hypothetical protein
MQPIKSPRIVIAALAVSAAGLAVGVGSAAAAGPQQTVTGTLISRPAGTLAPGSTVSASKIFGNRVFTGAQRGFALVNTGEAQYPATTVNGGKTWKTDGPALHLNAAQAPLSVVDIGAAGPKTIFAWGTGQVIDTTSDGGAHWYRATFFGLPVAVVKNPQGHLVAFVDGETNGNSSLQYVSKNGGKTWRLDTTIGGS